MADKRVNVLVYSGMSLFQVRMLYLLTFEFKAMVLRLSLSVTVFGLYVAC
jgi:hypothetical protein